MKGDTGWVVNTDTAVQTADDTQAHPSPKTRYLANQLLAMGSGQMPDELRERTAAEVQWGITFAPPTGTGSTRSPRWLRRGPRETWSVPGRSLPRRVRLRPGRTGRHQLARLEATRA